MTPSLEERIWNSFPVSQQAFIKFLELLDIEENSKIATACVSLGPRSKLLINPDFAERHCGTDDRLVMLVRIEE